jgi:hypothetical protein
MPEKHEYSRRFVTTAGRGGTADATDLKTAVCTPCGAFPSNNLRPSSSDAESASRADFKVQMPFVVFLQNAWSPVYAGGRWPRHSWIRALARSRSGKRLSILLDDYESCENTTPIVGATPDSVVPPDADHINDILVRRNPRIVVACAAGRPSSLSTSTAGRRDVPRQLPRRARRVRPRRRLHRRLPDADVILGGPPCQPFSDAGENEGEADDRDCIPDFCAAVERNAPPPVPDGERARAAERKALPYFGRVLERLEARATSSSGGCSMP